MARQQLFNVARRAASRPLTQATRSALPIQRSISSTLPLSVSSSATRKNKDDPFHDSSSATLGKPGFEHEGSQARTDQSIVVEYPESTDIPAEPTVQGRGGPHLKRTLPQFSLEGRTTVITGGARGLGLVMTQSIVASGADVAIVDLNSTCPPLHLTSLTSPRRRSRVLRKSPRRTVPQ